MANHSFFLSSCGVLMFGISAYAQHSTVQQTVSGIDVQLRPKVIRLFSFVKRENDPINFDLSAFVAPTPSVFKNKSKGRLLFIIHEKEHANAFEDPKIGTPPPSAGMVQDHLSSL